MKTAKAWLFAVAVVLGTVASADVLAYGGYHGGYHHGGYSHARVGVFIGAPLFYSPWYYPYAYYPAPYYYPPAYPSGPTTYVEQAQPEAAPAPRSDNRSDNYWYYCPEAKAYYPYVKQCAAGWQKVSPQPPQS